MQLSPSSDLTIPGYANASSSGVLLVTSVSDDNIYALWSPLPTGDFRIFTKVLGSRSCPEPSTTFVPQSPLIPSYPRAL